MGGPPVDLLLRDGRIAAADAAPGAEQVDGGGAIVVPGLVEAHTHLDKTLVGMAWYRNEVGPQLQDKIDNERRERRRLGIDPERQSARLALQALAFGSTRIRSHVDVDTELGVAAIEGVMATRERLAGTVDIEIVAFPQSGVLVRPGTAELLEEAMRMGSDVVGGLDPCAIDRDPRGHLDVVFGLAERFGRPVDIHLHEPGELGAFSLELIVERTLALGMQNKVAVSHAFCLGMPDPARVAGLVEQVAAAGIAIVTTAPPSRPVPAVRQLAAAGILTAAGSDGVRDTWGPYGNGDMLERAVLLGMRNNLRRDDELELALDICTRGGARLAGVEDHGVAPGCRADLVLLEGETVAEAIVSRRPRRLVIKGGRIVAREGRPLAEVP